MDLISWGLSAIDQIFSTRKGGKGEASCPDGTFTVGYTWDGWSGWNQMCLAILSIEDAEDIYIIGLMVSGFLLFGVGGFLIYRNGNKALAAHQAIEKLPVFEGLCRAVNAQTQVISEVNRKLEVIPGLIRKVDSIMAAINRP